MPFWSCEIMQTAVLNSYNIMDARGKRKLALVYVCVRYHTIRKDGHTFSLYLSACIATLNHWISLSLMWDLLQMSAKPHTRKPNYFNLCLYIVYACGSLQLLSEYICLEFSPHLQCCDWMSHKLAEITLIWLI